MVDREEKVLLSSDRLGRVAIVKRPDGFFCLYTWYHFSLEAQKALRIQNPTDLRWTADFDPALYYDAVHGIETKPETGIFERMEDADAEARRLLGLFVER